MSTLTKAMPSPNAGGRLLILVLVGVFLLSEVGGGALRYGLARVGMVPLVYLPKALLALALVGSLAAAVARARISVVYACVLGGLCLAAMEAYLMLDSPSQIAFGVWVLIPFMAGIVVAPTVLAGDRGATVGIYFLWSVAVAGVLLNLAYRWPWMGFEYALAGVQIEGARMWRTEELVRLSGFSRASFDAAYQILVFATLIVTWGSGVRRIAVWLVSGAAIAITTSKTAALVYVVLTLFWVGRPLVPSRVWRWLPAGVAFTVVLLPMSTLVVQYDVSSLLDNPIQRLLLASFGIRLEHTWPETLTMVQEHGNVMLGRGVGGIGMAQAYFEPVLYSPGDNLAVYLYALLGILGVAALVVYAVALSLLPVHCRVPLVAFAGGVVVLLAGVTANVVESGVLGVVFGASLRYSLGMMFRRATPETASDSGWVQESADPRASG